MGWEEKRDPLDQHAERHQEAENSLRGSRKPRGVRVKGLGSEQQGQLLPRLLWTESASGAVGFSPRGHW